MVARAMNAIGSLGMRKDHLERIAVAKKRVLFVCTCAQARSPTAEEMFSGATVEAKSAGTSTDSPNRVTTELINWAEIIFAMEEKHKQYLIEVDNSSLHKILVLDIPDIFGRNQPELRQLLLNKVQPYFEKFNIE